MRKALALLAVLVVVLFCSSSASAFLVNVYSIDGPQDPLYAEWWYHELGEIVFPANELIGSRWEYTALTACNEPPVDDPAIPNVLVTMTNLTTIDWWDVHYVADPVTGLTNLDGWIGNRGLNDAWDAFRIDSVGFNTPLISEDIVMDNVFQAGETWQFIIQDFRSAGPPTPFNSLGIASLSPNCDPSTGSIIARSVPEPTSCALLALAVGGVGVTLKRRRKK